MYYSRGPDEIFAEGFKGRGDSADIYAHAADNTSPASIYVSTSTSNDVALDFATDYFMSDGFLYTLRPNSGAIDVNAAFKSRGMIGPHPDEFELAIPNAVLPRDIRAVTPVNADGSYTGYSLLNSNWKR